VSPVWETGVDVVLISPLDADNASLRRILQTVQATLHRFLTCEDALSFLRARAVGVVIANVEMADGCWRDLLDPLALLKAPPRLIVSSRLADERLWAEVLNLGGYDVLLTPFETDEALRVCAAAWRSWKRVAAPPAPPHCPTRPRRPRAAAAATVAAAGA
jgi:DNA-binding NtrC family response regulator